MEIDPKVAALTAVAVAAGICFLALAMSGGPAKQNFAYIVPGTEDVAKGLGSIYRSPQSKEALANKMSTGEATAYESFQHGVKLNGSGRFLGRRKIVGKNEKQEPVAGAFEWQTYDEVNARVENFASGLVVLDLIPETPGTVETGPMRMLGLLLKNRPEWVIAEQACNRQSATTVPMYDTLGSDIVEMILNETMLSTVLAAPENFATVLSAQDNCPSLKAIICVDEATPQQVQDAKARGLQVYSFEQVEEKGKACKVPAEPPTPSTIMTFCYTSGTTGKSKGALLSHQNMLAVAASAKALGFDLRKTDRHLSYLPLAHVFERAVMLLVIYSGAAIGFSQGIVARLPDDIITLKPTLFPSVPRLLNRFYDKIMAGVDQQGGMKAKLFHMGFRAKQAGLRNHTARHWLWDKLVFSKIAARIGLGECRYLVSGSAPLAPHVLEFLRVLLGCAVVEGYGQTETAGVSTAQHFRDFSLGNVGSPVACQEIRLVAVPEMGYLITDRVHGADPEQGVKGIECRGRGEICFKGPNTFKGYFKMPDKTEEAFDSDGWLHSGDIGIWLPEGQLKIVDRKKNIFKLAQGEYIAPEKIENVYSRSSIIAQSFVYGDSFQHQLVAIVVPDAEAVTAFCAERGLAVAPLPELCKDPKFKKEVMADMTRLRTEAKLHGFEHAADIHLEPNPFTPDNDLLTPTFKLKRDVAKKVYAKEIDAMYAGLGGVAGKKDLKQ